MNDYPKILGLAIIKDEFAFSTPQYMHIGYIVGVNGDELLITFDRLFAHDSIQYVKADTYDVIEVVMKKEVM